jgi:DNA-binding NtrC family response regulator
VYKSTQTDDGLTLSGGSQPYNARLIRFMRADAPALGMDEYCLDEHEQWLLGRLDSNQPLPSTSELARLFSRDDALMSAKHARLCEREDGWEVEDLGSKNGTFINRVRLHSPQRLLDGDVLECGNSFFMYREADARPRVSLAPPARLGEAIPSVAPLHYQIAALLPFAGSKLALHLHGETGAGKDVVARAIHDLSGRRGGFAARNCAAVPETLFESELFGYTRGAFTGASTNKRGQIVEAHNGTLFLDEIGELSLSTQAKLLRVLELKEVLPVGATQPVPVDFRLISATLCDLQAMVEEGRFRKDLYGRLGHAFVVPPLREHKEYLGALLPGLLAASLPGAVRAVAGLRFSIAAARALVYYHWPFNIRELKQCIERALTAAWANQSELATLCIGLDDLPTPLLAACERALPSDATTDVRRIQPEPGRVGRASLPDNEILAALRSCGGNRAQAARVLKISERTMFRRIRKLRGDHEPGSAEPR